MFLDFGTDELESGGPSEVFVLLVGIAIAFVVLHLLGKIVDEAIKEGRWGYLKAALELGFFPAIYFAAMAFGLWALPASLVWCACYFYAGDRIQQASKSQGNGEP